MKTLTHTEVQAAHAEAQARREEQLSTLTFWDAVISWRDSVIYNREITSKTKDEYLSGVYRVIKDHPQLIETNLVNFINSGCEVFYRLIVNNSKWSKKTTKQRLDYFKSIYKHAIINILDITRQPIPTNHKNEISLSRAKKALSSPKFLEELETLSAEQMISLFSNLPKVNQRDFFIIKLVWLAQYPLALLLRLTFKNFVEEEVNVIEIDGESLDFEAEVLLEVAPYLYERVKEELNRLGVQSKYPIEKILIFDAIPLKQLVIDLLEETPELKDVIFFQTNKGQALIGGQIISTLKKACKLAKIKPAITPKLLYLHAILSTRKDRLLILEKMKWMDYYRNK